MKFVLAAVVVLAVAMGVQSSLIAGVPGLGLGVHGLGLGLGVPGIGLGHGLGGIAGPIGVHGSLLAPGAGWWGSPLIAPHIPAAVNIATHPHAGIAVAQQAALAPAGHGATYVAKTRGAIHTAPLAGHIHSAASVNVAPAPGTW